MVRLFLYFTASLGATLLVAAVIYRSRPTQIERIASDLQNRFPRLDALPTPESRTAEPNV
jgi:hypothetical protein